jgi:hypothetical protein
MVWLQGFLIGGLLISVTVLSIHDQQTIATLKRYSVRLKRLENPGDAEATTRP